MNWMILRVLNVVVETCCLRPAFCLVRSCGTCFLGFICNFRWKVTIFNHCFFWFNQKSSSWRKTVKFVRTKLVSQWSFFWAGGSVVAVNWCTFFCVLVRFFFLHTWREESDLMCYPTLDVVGSVRLSWLICMMRINCVVLTRGLTCRKTT